MVFICHYNLTILIGFLRYYSVQNKIFTSKQIVIVIVLCILLGIFWAALPLFGWSYYSQEKSLTSCCVEWLDRSFTVVSYNVTIFIFIFFIPVGIIAQTQISIYLNVSTQNKKITNINNCYLSKHKLTFCTWIVEESEK